MSNSKDLNMVFDSCKDLVEYILDEYPETRESDTKLIKRVFEEQSGNIIVIDESKMPALRSLTRSRQKIQNEEGNFLPEDDS